MAWIPDVHSNELILSAWGNTVRNHVVHTFATAAERDAAIPTPTAGMVCYLSGPKALQVHDGAAWRTIPGAGTSPVTYAEMGTPSGGVGATPTLIGALRVIFNTPGSRKVRLSGLVTVNQSTTASNAHVGIYEGATKLTESVASLTPGSFASMALARILTPAAGIHTYDVMLSTDAGVASVYAAPDFVSYFMAEDLGV